MVTAARDAAAVIGDDAHVETHQCSVSCFVCIAVLSCCRTVSARLPWDVSKLFVTLMSYEDQPFYRISH